MVSIKHFQTKPEHVEAMQFGGKNAKDICDWVGLFEEQYNLKIKNGGTYIVITALDSDVEWRATKTDWIIRSFVNEYFYVESATVMAQQYTKL